MLLSSIQTVALRSRRHAFRGAWLEPPRSRKPRALRGLKAHADPSGVGRLPLQATERSYHKVRIQE